MPERGKGIHEAARKANRGPSAGPGNRRAIIAAAREVFAADGLQAPFNAIAKRAGVGQGSLYRHFPDRLALAVAVFDENIDELEAAVEPENATLDDLLEAIIGQAVVSTALIDLIWQHQHDARVEHLGSRLAAIVGGIVARERTAGRVGDTVEDADVLLAVSMLADLLARTEAENRRPVAQRAWAIFHAAFAPR
ncbi:AcrR family transcriptional regulator [Agromyces cerinus]|uniref:AcrR family transcriptional regulator n=1 Tax=Agromyces hippuratus TaxID=286438 RepID=A0A852X0S6_9MICO|nr:MULTISPECIES: helix-turn-helix domain-containing protein [Agromyces]MBM7832410.1 AcrR family transcriptional regulator [Agromyces cerinus]NYG21753.1 AcrR family transcriptional regulator [Agromyces hippuratus]